MPEWNSLSRAACLAAVLVSVMTSARAADMGPEVRQEVRTAENYCKEQGGKPRTDAGFAKVLDLNADGAEDWILDFSKFHCDRSVPPEPYCGSGGCSLTVFLWRQGEEWTKAFDDTVQRYRLLKRGPKFELELVLAGNMCGESNAHSCRETYEFIGNRLVRKRKNR